MSVIKRLPADVASRIAAGEVVERPYNAVKELVENALDAGATKIIIEIADGGLSLIRISDNGSGIVSSELPLAVERFATSKAETVEDVYAAKTFGFRGEALAAISSVSSFTMRSGRENEGTFELHSEFGELSAVKPSAATKGTVVEVMNLFENLPARRKFLKSGKSLEAEVIRLVKQMSLINPSAEISLYVNSKEVYHASSSDDICMRASKVFPGKGFVIGSVSFESISCTVACTLPQVSDRLKRDAIVIGVNGRLIKDPSLLQAVIQAYYRLTPEGRYPAAAVDIRMKPEEVDANVHPAKLEVRFEHPQEIFAIVKDSVTKAFEGRGGASEYGRADNTEPEIATYLAETLVSEPVERKEFPTKTFIAPKVDMGYTFEIEDKEPLKEFEDRADITAEGFEIIGQIEDMYIVCQAENSREILFIDQHAAHERILFEKIEALAKVEKMTIVLHEPYGVELTDEEYEALTGYKEIFAEFGYSYELKDDHRADITRVPVSVVRADIGVGFRRIIAEYTSCGSSRTEDGRRVMLSCKSAIKAGDKLSVMEMEYLVKLLMQTKNFATCPHGRPIIYRMSLNELSRKFLR